MSSGSVSTSTSVSDECCFPISCACDDWLTVYCDYETVTLDSCGVETEFAKARSKGIRMNSANPQFGVHSSDRVFKLSMNENDVEVVTGGVITDSDGTEWVIYAVDPENAFCVKRVWARSVAACFQLIDNIEVFEKDCSCEDCGVNIKWIRKTRVRGKIVSTSGSLSNRNDSNDLVYRFSGDLVRWGLKTRPSANHRLKVRGDTYRITGVRDDGIYVPFHVDLEIDSAACC